MTALIWIPLLGPALLAAASFPARRAAWTRATPPIAAALLLACGLAATATVHANGPVAAAGGLLRVDALTAYLLAVVGAVAVTATWAWAPGRPDGWFSALMGLFLAAMTLALLADDLGVMWVAVEATTITTAFLVGYRGGRNALEAAWKYVVLGSVGVAIAFLGIVLVYAATTSATPTLSWTALTTQAILNPDIARIGLALTVLGFATKAGLAPMHSWLPDAHSQAPAPVSALMSGVLLSVAFSAILRVKAISDLALGPALMRNLLTIAGLLSLLVAAALILTQRDYKRMLAYSSIEHMGILALGAAVGGPLATTAVLLHILGHGLAKASMFIVAGRILTATTTSRIDHVDSLLTSHPTLARPWLAGTAALLGFPPFGLFLTEIAIIAAGFKRGLTWTMAVALGLLLVVFAGLTRHALSMTLTRHDTPGSVDQTLAVRPDETSSARRAVTTAALTTVALLTVAAWPLRDVLTAAAAVLGGTP